jgi:hypothetical protein
MGQTAVGRQASTQSIAPPIEPRGILVGLRRQLSAAFDALAPLIASPLVGPRARPERLPVEWAPSMKTPLVRVTSKTAWDEHDSHVRALEVLEASFKAKVAVWLTAHRGEYVALQGEREIFGTDYAGLRAQLDLTKPYFIATVELPSK